MKKILGAMKRYPIVAITIAAAILRLIAVFFAGDYTVDDSFSIHFASMKPAQMFSFLKFEVHPPLYYLLLHFWLMVLGDNPMITRLLSVIFSVAAVPLIYYLGKEIATTWVGIVSSLILTLSYFSIFNAIQVRMYSLVGFLGLLSLTLFWLIAVKQKKKLTLLYLLVNILTLFTHLGGILSLATQWLWILILQWQKRIDRRTVKNLLLQQLPALLLWLAWFELFFWPVLPTLMSLGWHFNLASSHSVSIGLYDFFFLLLRNYWLRLFTGTIIFSAPLLVLLWSDKMRLRQLAQPTNPGWFMFAWAIPGFFLSVVTDIGITRIFIISYLGFVVLVAYCFWLMRSAWRNFFVVLITGWFSISMYTTATNITNRLSRWDQIIRYIAATERPNDTIILYSSIEELPFHRYYSGITPHISLYPFDDDKTMEQRIVEHNWQNYIVGSQLKQIAAVDDAQRIIMIHELDTLRNTYVQQPIHQWMVNRQWHMKSIYQPKALFGPTVIVYTHDR